jgi:O-antigen/teichoic acid export membrane protein
MQLSTKVAYNTIIQAFSKTISTALGLVGIAVITRYLGQTGFGEYTTIITFISFFAVIADFGLTLVTIQMISQPGADEDKILGNLFALRLFTALFCLGIAPLLVLFFPYSYIIKTGVLIASAAFLFNALCQILVGLFQKRLRLDKVAIAEVISRVVLVAGFFIVAKWHFGIIAIIVVTVIANGLSFLLHYLFSLSYASIKLRYDKQYWQEIFHRAWPLAITIVLNLIYLRADILLLSIIPRPSTSGIIAEVGLYGAAYKVIDVLVTFPFMFSGVVLPILTARWAEANFEGFKNILQRSFDVLMIMIVPIVVGTQIVARQIMTLVAGPDFAASGQILQLLIFACGAVFCGNIFAHAIIAINQQKRIIKAYLFTAVTSLIGYLLFIPTFSYYGAAAVTIYSEIAIAVFSFYLVWQQTKFIPRLNVFAKTILAALIMSLPTYYFAINHYNLIITLTAAALVYAIALYLLRGLKKEDFLILINK